jgi:probable F420-dependent oxidoreductase
MRYNLVFPSRAVKHWNHWSEGASLGDVAKLVENAGFDAFSMTEHPYPDKHWLAHGGHHAFDPFVSLSFVAAATTRLRVITYVMVAGYRNPYMAAKSAASLDLLSGGRLILGTAVGYLKSEFEAVGGDFARRGELFDEAIQAWKSTWAGHPHTGPAFGVDDHVALPLPHSPGGPPIWIGGNGAAARRRVVEVADGWVPFIVDAEMSRITGARPLQDLATLSRLIADVNRRRAESGRGPADVAFSPFEVNLLARGDALDMFCAAIRPRLDDYAEAGVTWLSVGPTSRSFGDFRADVDVLASKLIHT